MRLWISLFQQRTFRWGVGLFLAWVLLSILAPWIASFGPHDQPDIFAQKYQAPGSLFWFGSDHLSRDVFSRVLFGARNSIYIGLLSALMAISLGAFWGILSGYRGGKWDQLLMRILEIFLSIPRLVFLLVLIGIYQGPLSTSAVVFALALTGWMGTARLVRAQVLSLKKSEFFIAGQSIGLGHGKMLVSYVLPNCVGTLLASACLAVCDAILYESTLSFLGVISWSTPSWGSMVYEGAQHMIHAPWTVIFPGASIFCVVFASHLIGEGVEESLRPVSYSRA